MARQPRNQDDFLTDAQLGIGEEVAPATDDLAALLANPAFAKLIDAAVTARVAQLAVPASGGVDTSALNAFTETLKHVVESQSKQLPGYQKPLPMEELDRRAAGHVEMRALLADYERRGTPPLWTVGEGGFFECTNAMEFVRGQQIRTYLPPPEDFVPENEEARKVHAAMMRWLGVRTPDIGEQVKQAHLDSKLPPLITGTLEPVRKSGLVEVVGEAPTVPQKLRRSMGSIVPERREVTMAERAQGPQGPMFVGEAA